MPGAVRLSISNTGQSRVIDLPGTPYRLAQRELGIGVGFVPDVLNRSILDEVITVTDEEAFVAARRLAHEGGVLAGVSSGSAIHAALRIASRPEAAGKMIVVLLADTAERYVSSPLFERVQH